MEPIHFAPGECCDLFLEIEGAEVDVCRASSVARLEFLRSATIEKDDILSLDRADSLLSIRSACRKWKNCDDDVNEF
jgi:hypothetical protein